MKSNEAARQYKYKLIREMTPRKIWKDSDEYNERANT